MSNTKNITKGLTKHQRKDIISGMRAGKKYNLNILCTYRDEIKGICVLGILACHSVGNGVLLRFPLSSIMSLGNYCVDIFLFLSGMGLFYSLAGYDGNSYIPWLRKRLTKIIVPTLMLVIPLRMIRCFQSGLMFTDSIRSIIVFLTTIPYWTDHNGDWFVIAILICILFSPLLWRAAHIKGRMMFLTAFVVFCMLGNLSIQSLQQPIISAVIKNAQFIIVRLPSFAIGLYFGQKIKNGEEVPLFATLIGPVLAIIALINPYMQIHVGGLLSFPCASIMALFINKVQSVKWIRGCLQSLGRVSLESYLTNVYFSKILAKTPLFDIGYGHYLYYFVVCFAGIGVAFAVHKVNVRILKALPV